jgi:hypothetical protein
MRTWEFRVLLLLLLLLQTGAVSVPIVVFDSGLTLPHGNIGTRAQTTSTCAARATAVSLQCSNVFMFIAYTGENVQTPCVPGGGPCFSPVLPVVGNTPGGLQIANNWGTIFAQGSLTNSFTQSVYGHGSGLIWTGMTPTGFPQQNCLEWQSGASADSGLVGDGAAVTGGTWLQKYIFKCDSTIIASISFPATVLCVCLPPPSVSPSPAPSRSPTVCRPRYMTS